MKKQVYLSFSSFYLKTCAQTHLTPRGGGCFFSFRLWLKLSSISYFFLAEIILKEKSLINFFQTLCLFSSALFSCHRRRHGYQQIGESTSLQSVHCTLYIVCTLQTVHLTNLLNCLLVSFINEPFNADFYLIYYSLFLALQN